MVTNEKRSVAYIGLGSNLGDRLRMLQDARDMIANIDTIELVERSSIYESEAMGMAETESAPFLNQVIKIVTSLTPHDLLQELEKIEVELGRSEKRQLKARSIDLDLLLFDDLIVKDTKLTLPHPGIVARAFVLIPLLEISPLLDNPHTSRPFTSYLPEVASQQIKRINDSTHSICA